MKLYALLDVGGTEIKRRTVSEDGIPIDQITHFPSKSKADSATIINNLSEIIRNGNGMLPECVAMAFPGPFDYENGISYMKGIGKYDSIYGKPLRCMLYKVLGREMPIISSITEEIKSFISFSSILSPNILIIIQYSNLDTLVTLHFYKNDLISYAFLHLDKNPIQFSLPKQFGHIHWLRVLF